MLGRAVVICRGAFKSITPGHHLSQYASLRETSSLEMGVVLCPHVSELQQDRKVFVLIYDGTLCFSLTLALALRLLYYFPFVTAWPAGFKVDSTHVFKGRS